MAETRDIDIKFGTNAPEVKAEIDSLNDSITKAETSTNKATQSKEKANKIVKESTEATKSNSQAVLDNGGAMGILNMLTGGYAQIVKDSVEASTLFTRAKKADTVATEASTVAVVSDNTARQLSIIAKVKEYASDVASKVAKLALAGATKVVTVAQWLWNAAVVANPLVALVVAIVAAGAAIYKLTSYLIDSSKANEKATIATKKGIEALDAQTKASKANSDAIAINNKHTYDMAKASGASAEELRKLSLSLAEKEIQVLRNSATTARNTAINEKNTYSLLKQAGASDEVIEAQRKLAVSAIDEFNKENDNLKEAYKAKAQLIRDNEIEVTQETTSAQKERLKNQKEADKKAKDDAIALNKEKIALEKKYLSDIENLRFTSEEFKLAKQKRIDLEEIEALKQKGVDVRELLRANTEKCNILENELKVKRAEELKTEDDLRDDDLRKKDKERTEKKKEDSVEKGADELAGAKAFSDEKVRIANEEAEQIAKNKDAILQTGQLLLDGAKMLAGKNKGIQRAAIIAEGAVALGKVGMNIAEGVTKDASEGAILSVPLIVKTLATGVFATASIVSNTSKALSALGGGGAPSAGGSSIPAGAQPSVNFVASNENQIANSINANEQNKEPIKAYVVSKEVTTAQELDRNIINSTTI